MKKTKTAPWGMAGGDDGDAGYVLLRPGTDRELKTGMVYEAMAPDDVLVNHSGGGGGWGDPFERHTGAVLADVVDEYVSVDGAREDYGVVIDAATMAVDEGATTALRRTPRAGGFA